VTSGCEAPRPVKTEGKKLVTNADSRSACGLNRKWREKSDQETSSGKELPEATGRQNVGQLITLQIP
jgi:hypothetical protein